MENNKTKRIAKNTVVLYFRMIFLMLISLYTSRVILKTLGVDDYGIYNVVGGFVAMFAVVCNALSGACGRFLNYEMGAGNHKKLNMVFSSSVTIHIVLSLIIILLAESVGLWFLNYKMVIPTDRLFAANWCFQLSLITFCSTLISVPYKSAIIAHEKMSVFAYISIYEGVGKLVIALLIGVSPIDNLICYAVLLCILQTTVQFFNMIYCRRRFVECKYNLVFDRKMLNSILGYSVWNFFGHASGIIRNQGGNVLINLFFGTAANAARGIANQVLNALTGLVSSFTTAITPQISQSYASGDIEYMKKLVYAEAKFSYFLMLFVSLPVLYSTDFLLGIWLQETPDYAIQFTQLMIIFSLIESLNNPIQHAQSATGNIKVFQFVVGMTQMTIIPISYIWLKNGGSVYTVFYVSIVWGILSIYIRLFLLKRVLEFDILDYSKKVLLPVLCITIISVILPSIACCYFTKGVLNFFILSFICLINTSIPMISIGFTKNERKVLFSKIPYIKDRF